MIFTVSLILAALILAALFYPAKGASEKRVVYLTFDDGPTLNTPYILDTLKKYGAKATFFVLDDRITLYADCIRRIEGEGHAIGLHGVTHDVNKIYAAPTSPLDEMNAENETLFSVLGRRSRLCRTPYGSCPYMSKKQAALLTSSGYLVWDWTVDPRDSISPGITTERTLKNLASGLNETDFPVILLHDRKTTANALEEILKYLTENGYECRAISEKQPPKNKFDKLK